MISSTSRRLARAVLLGLLGTLALAAIWAADDARAAFPGENGRIAYSVETDTGAEELWTVNPDGSDPIRLTEGNRDYSPTYSPDGTRIAFERGGDIYAMNSDGSGVTKLFGEVDEEETTLTWEEDFEDPVTEEIYPFVRIEAVDGLWESLSRPSFSPDGASLVTEWSVEDYAFEEICAVEGLGDETCIELGQPGYYTGTFNSEFDEFEGVRTISSTTGAVLDTPYVAEPGDDVWSPAYSVDGRLAFMSDGGGSGGGLYVISSPAATPQLLVPGARGAADFSPDGSKLVAVSASEEELLVADANSGAILSTIPTPLRPGVEDVELQAPKFSPDGTRIAFGYDGEVGFGDDQRATFTVGVDGSGLTEILDDAPDFAWQPLPRTPPPDPRTKPTRRAKTPPLSAAKPAVAIAKKHARLDRRGRATIGWIVCGTSPCAPRIVSSKLKVGKRGYPVRASAPKRLAPGKRAKLRVKVKGKALRALKKKGKGRLTTRVRTGKGRKPKRLRSTLKPKRRGARR